MEVFGSQKHHLLNLFQNGITNMSKMINIEQLLSKLQILCIVRIINPILFKFHLIYLLQLVF